MLKITLYQKPELKKKLVKDPKNPSRTKWSYWVKIRNKRKDSFYRISRRIYFDLKYERLTIADIMP